MITQNLHQERGSRQIIYSRMGAQAAIGLYRLPSGRLCCPSGQLYLERLCHFLFQLCSISILHTSAAALQALSKGFHLTVLARDGVIRVLVGAEQERDVLTLTDAVVHPSGIFNPIVHNANHHIGSQWIVHGQKEPAGGGSIQLVKVAHGLADGMGLVHHPAQRQNGYGIYFCFKHNQLTHLMLLTMQWPCRVTSLQAAGTSTS